MRVLILGSGGREHAIGWKISSSSLLEDLHFGPGNAGTSALGTNVDLDPMDFAAVEAHVREHHIDMVVVGPEAPLAAGIVDHFASAKGLESVAVIGPGKEGAQLESSKKFAKEFMKRHRIPTAKFGTFGKADSVMHWPSLKSMKAPYVVKASGLAAGKGVIVTEDLKEAEQAVRSMLKGEAFGSAGKGRDRGVPQRGGGVHVRRDRRRGVAALALGHGLQAHRRGQHRPNTGGMGAISPVPHVDPEFMEKVKNQVVIPTIRGIQRDGIAYRGFLFFGLMKVQGDPYVIEYNCRLGDPETQIILLLETDLLHMMDGLSNGLLSEIDVALSGKAAATITLASGGYPGSYSKGIPMALPAGADIADDQLLFHAGTRQEGDGVVTAGGRVLACIGFDAELENAVKKAYALADKVEFDGKTLRTDIGTVG